MISKKAFSKISTIFNIVLKIEYVYVNVDYLLV